MWAIFRLCFILFCLLVGVFNGSGLLSFNLSLLIWLVAAFIFGLYITRFHVFRKYQSKKLDEKWLLPSWRLNPFHFGQPFQFFHLGALSFMSNAAGTFIRSVFDSMATFGLPKPTVFGFVGAGMWFGIYLAISAHRARFTDI